MALNKVPYVDGVTVITAENLNDIQDAIIALENAPAQGLTEDMKQALLQIARKVAYIDDQGQTYYDDLYDAFYPPKTVVLITAVFEQGSTVIYDDTALDDLKQYLTVTAKYDDNTTAILPDSAYTLTGLLEAPSSTVTVLYNGVSTTFSVAVTARPALSSISAVYTQSGTVYDIDTLDSLKDDLVVTAHYSDSSTQTVPAADYTLSGTLTAGTSTITVAYGGKTTTFNVTVTSTYMFSVADRVMTVDDSIDTGVDLISTDRDFSICLDIAITQFNGQPKIYYQFENASPWRGLVFGHGASNSFNCKYINAYEVISRAASSLTKVKAVISHTSGSGKAFCYYRFNEETSTSSATVNNEFVSLNPSANLTIGKHTTNTWAGTINRFDIRSFALTQAQAESFITGE